MRSKSPKRMNEIKKYIEDYYLQNRQSPSTTKIAEAVGIARGTAYKYLVEMAENNAKVTLENKELAFHYRTSFLKTHPNYICLEATIKLEKGKKEAIEEVMKSRLQRRKEAQPLEYPSAGSVFRNPPGMFSGELIENCGLKGKKIGGAQVSEKHANFIINTGNATANDVKELIDYVKKEVEKKYHVSLTTEQEFVNWE